MELKGAAATRDPTLPRRQNEKSKERRGVLHTLRLCLVPESTKERKKMLRKMIFSCLVVL